LVNDSTGSVKPGSNGDLIDVPGDDPPDQVDFVNDKVEEKIKNQD
jgi:hypothetical protein